MVIFAGGKFRENVGKTFNVGVIFTILLLVMFRLSAMIDCRSIIAKNSDYRSKISKIDHRKQIMYEMRNVKRTECNQFELAIIYNMATSIDANQQRYGGLFTREGHLPNFI